MKAVVLQIELLQPVLAAHSRPGEENSSESFDYLPGSMLRGALVGRYLQMHPAVTNLALDETARQWFFDGGCAFLNAYPVCGPLNTRMLPAPHSWMVEKETPKLSIYDFAAQYPNPRAQEPKKINSGFVALRQQGADLARPEFVIHVHNASQQRGVKREADSFVYRYEALAAGQVFAAVIVGPHSHDLADALRLRKGDVFWLGGSRTSNYGKVSLRAVNREETWQEAEASQSVEGITIITFVSDAILHDAMGQPTLNPDRALGASQPALRSFIASRMVGGFNRKWGLPLPQSQAIAAGSVFVYPSAAFDLAALNALVESGVGERRVEGFGRMIVNWHTRAQFNQYAASTPERMYSPSSETDHQKLSSASRQMAERMVERKVRQLLERRLTRALLALEINPSPKLSQLARLRSAARAALSSGDLRLIAAHVVSLRSAFDQLERSRVKDAQRQDNAEKLNEWLKKQVVDNQNTSFPLWDKYFKLNDREEEIAGVTLPTGKWAELRIEYTARLLDSLFRKTARRVQQEQKQKGGG